MGLTYYYTSQFSCRPTWLGIELEWGGGWGGQSLHMLMSKSAAIKCSDFSPDMRQIQKEKGWKRKPNKPQGWALWGACVYELVQSCLTFVTLWTAARGSSKVYVGDLQGKNTREATRYLSPRDLPWSRGSNPSSLCLCTGRWSLGSIFLLLKILWCNQAMQADIILLS